MSATPPVRVKIVNQRGLHARAAARFARMAGEFSAEIIVSRDGHDATGDSILELLMLGAGPGQEILLSAKGEDSEQALVALVDLVSGGFDEGEG